MGKKSNQDVEPLFTPLKTTDDDDDVELAQDGGPAPSYRDDPQASSSTPPRSSSDDGGPATSYRDDPGSIFDWGDDNDNNNANAKSSSNNRDGDDGGAYVIDEFDADANGFAPVSLQDSDDDDDSNDDDEERNGSDFDGNGTPDQKIRRKANKLLKSRVFDDTTYDETDERIFVGGGWGRHGSQFSLCPRGCCKAKYSYGPPKPTGYSTCQLACWTIAFLTLVIGSGFIGYESGLTVDDDFEDPFDGDATNTSGNIVHHPHTKGQEWMQWLEHEKQDFHMPKFNWTAFHHENHPKLNDEETNESFRKSSFEPMAQAELLKLSENIFQSCSERSLKTATGRNACTSQCHGHYCCFEKDVEFGSCVAEANSYCFAYAACENAITDFAMNNANTPSLQSPPGQEHNLLNQQDKKLLSETCSEANVATLAGIRDCTAFCEHHLCCFNELESENCRSDQPGMWGLCQAYDACRILVEGPESLNIGGEVIAKEVVDGDKGNLADAIIAARNSDSSGGNGGDNNSDNSNNNGGSIDSNPVAKPQPVVEHTFKADCLQSNLHDNWDICKNHCSRYECCFRRENSCYSKNSLECDEYYICEEFYLDNDNPDVSVVGGESNQGSSNSLGSEEGVYDHNDADVNKDIGIAVHAVCGLEDAHPGDDSWVTACHALCADHLCCFASEDSQSNCRSQKGEAACNAHQGCSVLVDNTTPSSSNDNSNEKKQQEINEVLEACTAKAHRDPWLAERCRKACSSRSCCFEAGAGGCSDNSIWCDEFQACEVIYT